ncbi:MbnP family protein [Hymenobacter sp. CRA2]|uniref:MbnP family protein n=1 Tax=Hymenobacter sp. CRA2 TaxID=1955620 RepID=UPI00098E8AEF|nr:MbnP family protein [Hymenobacter sp. CRA2]OON67551.1 hypothetical protein B0919_17115 [Hymenobacter sp. CRA2]
MNRTTYPLLLAGLLALAACESKKEQPEPQLGTVELHVENVAGSSPLALNTPYTTAAGDAFRVSTLTYYLSNIRLLRADGTSWDAPDSYYLIDQADPTSGKFTLSEVPLGDYAKVMMTIGVDSVRNTRGVQTGALDPMHGMFWDWNQGYVFFRLNGSSPQAPGNGGLFYDVAGFRHPYNTIRTVTLTLPNGTAALHVRGGDEAPEMHIKADVLKAFDGPRPVRFASLNSAAGGAPAMQLADNYAAGMFRIDHVHGN